MENDSSSGQQLPPQAHWNTFNLESERCQHWQAGPLNLWFKVDDGDWLVADKNNPEELHATSFCQVDSEPADLKWKRWVFDKDHNQLELMPAMPDRPVVIEARMPSTLPPSVQANFYVSIPLWAKLSLVKKNETVEMQRIASTVMSNTWFGDNFQGELCYALKSRAVRELSDINLYPHRAICPITIHNQSDTALPIQKICLRVQHLNIYATQSHFWTSTVKVIFRGEGLNSRLQYGNKPPPEAASASLMQLAEEAVTENFFQTFSHNIRSIF